MLLHQLLKGQYLKVYTGQSFSFERTEVFDITVDSRLVKEGTVFAVIKGYEKDGMDFVSDAYERGARVFLSDRIFLPKDDCAVIKCKNVRKTVALLASVIYEIPWDSLAVVGVTGTKGKTTVAYLISRLLSVNGIKSFSIGTLGVTDDNGKVIINTESTTPDSPSLYSYISRAHTLGARVVVIEASSQALKDHRLYNIPFSVGVFTSLGVDHIGINEHESFLEYAKAKQSLFTSYGIKTAVVNCDDMYAEFMGKSAEKCIKCGFSSDADFKLFGNDNDYFLCGYKIESSLFGAYNAINIALSVAVCNTIFGVDIPLLMNALPSVKIPGRMEVLDILKRKFVIDFAHNEMSFRAVISLWKEVSRGKVIVVYGAIGDRNRDRRGGMATAAEELADYSVITADDTRTEDARDICEELFSYYADATKAEIVIDRESAIRKAFEISAEGDAILLLGKGHEHFLKLNGRSVPFSEYEIVKRMEKEILAE